MRFPLSGVFVACAACISAATASASYVIEIDTDGADDSTLTYHPNFSFGGDTTMAFQSSPSSAVGLTGGDSIYGGNGASSPDTYVFSYTPGTDGDNLSLGAGTPLNNDGNFASGKTAGGSGLYDIYATWPTSTNVSGGPTTFSLTDGVNSLFSVSIDQNGIGNEWIWLGSANLNAATTYQLVQQAESNTFVSMRSSGALFDAAAVPEPSFCGLLGVAGFGLAWRRKRRARRAAVTAV